MALIISVQLHSPRGLDAAPGPESNVVAAASAGGGKYAGASPLEWSVRMADSEMARRGNTLAWTQGGRAKWDYTTGLFTFSLLKLHDRMKEPRYFEFARDTIGSFITADGRIRGYRVDEFNLDNLNPGRTILELSRLTRERRFEKAADGLRRQLDGQPRTREGGFWHKQRYPHQMWLDGLYMAEPFYVEYTVLFGQPDGAFDDVARQFLLVANHTYDPVTGLFFHGWDEDKQQAWANPATGVSSNFWGRAIGWYGMALVDVLDWFPTNHPQRAEIIRTLQRLTAGILKYQEPESGLWYQVVDQGGRRGNYLESTASSMFVYVLAKAVNRGYVGRGVEPEIRRGYRGIIEKLVKEDDKRRITLTQCCAVAGLGDGRDGSYDYYIKEPIVDNDLKGIGPFILSGLEVQRLVESSAPAPSSRNSRQ